MINEQPGGHRGPAPTVSLDTPAPKEFRDIPLAGAALEPAYTSR